MQGKRHFRDEKISFEESSHTYTVEGKNLISVTTLIHSYFPEFEAEKVAEKIISSPNWPFSKYYPLSKEEIIASWERKGKKSRDLGTLMHAQIENYLLSNVLPEKKSIEFSQFLNFWTKFCSSNPSFSPYRIEWRVYSSEVAGSIDFVLENKKTGSLIIIDWKRSKEIKKNNKYSRGKGVLSHLEDCNYVHYSLQLNAYRVILEKFYHKKVAAMYLLIFHPQQEDYKYIEIPVMKEAELIIN